MKKITGIRKRWMVNSISVVLFIVLLAVAAFSAAMGSYYYSTLSESLKQKAENAISSFDYYRTEAEYYDNARAVVAGEPNSDKLEVEYLDADGQIRFSSSDLTAFRSPRNAGHCRGHQHEAHQGVDRRRPQHRRAHHGRLQPPDDRRGGGWGHAVCHLPE